MKDHYQTLEVSPTATQEEIKKAWREQLQVWHPDRFNHNPALRRKAEERTKEINEAYAILGDSAKRQHYDEQRRSSGKSWDEPTASRSEEIVITNCPNPVCGIRLRVRNKGRLHVSCPECGCTFVFDTERGAKEDIRFRDHTGTSEKDTASSVKTTDTRKWTPGGIAALVAGAAVGKYAGIHLLIPLAGTVLVLLLAAKFTKLSDEKALLLFSVQGGQLLWFTTALLLAPAQWTLVSLDMLVLAGGLAWLLSGTAKKAIVFLCIYQGISFLANGFDFIDATPGSGAHKALMVHLIWRGIALWLMIDYLWNLGQRLKAMINAFRTGQAA